MTDESVNRRGYLQGVGAASVLATAGCLSSDGSGDSGDGPWNEQTDKIRFLTWNLEFLSESIEQWATEYEDKHGVKAEWIDRPSDQIRQYIQSTVQAGNPPQAINTGAGYYFQYAEDGVFIDIREHAPDDLMTTFEERFGEDQLAVGEVNDKLTGVPWYLGGDVLYYKSKYFDEMGFDLGRSNEWSLQEFFDNMEALANETDANYGFTMKFYPDVFRTLMLGWEPSIPFIDEEETKVKFDRKETVELVSRLQDLTASGVIPEETWQSLGSSDQQSKRFAMGDTGAYLGSNAILREITSQADWTDVETLGISSWPKNASLYQAMYWSIPEEAEPAAKVAAAYLIETITNMKWSLDFLKETTVLVANKEANRELANDDEFTEKNPLLAAVYEQFFEVTETGNIHPPMRHENGSQLMEEVATEFSVAALGEKSPEKAVSDAAKKANQLLE